VRFPTREQKTPTLNAGHRAIPKPIALRRTGRGPLQRADVMGPSAPFRARKSTPTTRQIATATVTSSSFGPAPICRRTARQRSRQSAKGLYRLAASLPHVKKRDEALADLKQKHSRLQPRDPIALFVTGRNLCSAVTSSKGRPKIDLHSRHRHRPQVEQIRPSDRGAVLIRDREGRLATLDSTTFAILVETQSG